MAPAIFLYLVGAPLLWLIWIRPYCIRNRQGFTPGANMGLTMWVDWQQASEIAKAKGDGGMRWVCRIFLGLHLLVAVAWVAMLF